jgi:hypothetical protein
MKLKTVKTNFPKLTKRNRLHFYESFPRSYDTSNNIFFFDSTQTYILLKTLDNDTT